MNEVRFWLAFGGLWLAASLCGCAVGPAGPGPEPTTNGQAAMSPKQIPAGLTDEALRIHRAGILIDGHNDLPWKLREKGDSSLEKLDIAQVQEDLQTDIPRLIRGGVGAQFWVAYVPAESAQTGGSARIALEQIDLIHRMVRHYSEYFEMAYTADDIVCLHRRGKIACLIGIENGQALENSLGVLRMFYALGARYLTLTHADTHDWADSATDEARHGGLSPFGEEVVREMNRLGMLVDISHVSAETAKDVLRVSRAPVIASHSSADALAPQPRNVPDEVLGLLAENGGLIMINFGSGFLSPEGAQATQQFFEDFRKLREQHPDKDELEKALEEWKQEHPIPAGTVGTLVDHIDHVVKVAGVDYVGLGSDYDGVSKLPEKLEDVSGYPYVTQELLNRGYSEQHIHKIMGGNLLRVLRRAEQVARDSQAE